jgi:hypothetical protein
MIALTPEECTTAVSQLEEFLDYKVGRFRCTKNSGLLIHYMPALQSKEGNWSSKIGFEKKWNCRGWCGRNRQGARSADPHQDTAVGSQEIGATEEIPWAGLAGIYLVKVRGSAIQGQEASLSGWPLHLEIIGS